VGFLAGLELGLLAAESALGLGDGHAFAGAGAGEVGFELRDHRQRREQEPANGIGGVMDGAAESASLLAR